MVPSGDHAGAVPVSSGAEVEPPIVSTLIEPACVKASFVPSADHAGSLAPTTSGDALTVCALSVVTV